MESKEETESKLQLYKAQLEQVNQLLLIEPVNEQFLTLKEDLAKVINLTEELLSQYFNPSINDEAPLNVKKGDNSRSNEDQYNLSDLEDDQLNESNIKKQQILAVGDRVEVTGGDRPYAGVITDITVDNNYKLRYYEFDTVVTLPASNLSLIPSGPYSVTPHLVTVGTKYQCKFAADQTYYNCTVNEATKYGFSVTFNEYGNSEEVPVEYLRPLLPEKDTKVKDTKKDGDSKSTELIPIPANLKILPTDTEEVNMLPSRLLME